LRTLLEDRRRQVTAGLTELMREVRARSDKSRVTDGQDGADVELRDDLDLALLQMRGETLARIDAALRRLEAGTYGVCGDCDQHISSERLQALPFAARCRTCEEAREAATTPRRSGAAKAYTYHAIE
jgi:DnaK suppressor protein